MGAYDDYKLLVANRGEIAVRILHTARKIGLRTVAIYTASDALSHHVRLADEAVLLKTPEGTSQISEASSYLAAADILQICKTRNVNIVHPGYGFLSENAAFAESLVANGIIWCGPRPSTIRLMGIKHEARRVAIAARVDVVPGSEGLVATEEEALNVAASCSYPVILKATAGGGGMGMVICEDEGSLKRNFAPTKNRAEALFNESGLFLEKYYESARHIEVQIFGNGLGDVVHMRERECSVQRRHQKVIEETPSPFCMARPGLRERIVSVAKTLAQSIKYNSAGTVEFLVDDRTSQFFFLEMNTRIQVEHTITEQTHDGLDLVELMIKQSIAEHLVEKGLPSQSAEMTQTTYDDMVEASISKGASNAMEARIYAENPNENFIPSPGLLQHVSFGDASKTWKRVDSWIETGISITPFFDPLIAKVVVSGNSRQQALSRMLQSLQETELLGPTTNLHYLQDIISSSSFESGTANTQFLATFSSTPCAVKVLSPGIDMTVQDLPGRTVGNGMPRSGPMDDLAFSVGNILVGNKNRGTEGLEIIVVPGVACSLQFFAPAIVAITGKPVMVNVDGIELPMWSRICLAASSKMDIAAATSPNGRNGFRTYLCVLGGFPDIPHYLGSKSTSMGLGGYQGRSLTHGDYLSIVRLDTSGTHAPYALATSDVPQYSCDWTVSVLSGPHGDEEFIRPEGISAFYSTSWRVSPSSNRLGIRLQAPSALEAIQWAKDNGGEGGAHPSNILDNGYAPGTINLNGDTPVILTKEGPDMGGYVCLCTVADFDMWKLGQVAPGDTIVFRRISWDNSQNVLAARDGWLEALTRDLSETPDITKGSAFFYPFVNPEYGPAILHRSMRNNVEVVYRQAGDSAILVEFGSMTLDIIVRVRIHAFQKVIEDSSLVGVERLCPCIRSIMCYFNPQQIVQSTFLQALIGFERRIPENIESMQFPARKITFPIVLDDKWNRDALKRYMTNTRDKAVYLPSNIEYLARNNGLKDETDALNKLIQSDFLVLGIGFYLACPFMVPIDPRCRLIGQKMNPSRTFTPRGAIGIAGPVAAIYPIESPGGYQLFGRTLPAWQTWGKGKDFKPTRPWLLEAFDQITFVPVDEDEYAELERQFDAGQYEFKESCESLMTTVTFSVREHKDFLLSVAEEVEAFRKGQTEAGQIETLRESEILRDWEARRTAESREGANESTVNSLTSSNGQPIVSPLFSTVWKINCQVGDVIKSDSEVLFILEATKTEIPVISGQGSKGKIVSGLNVREGLSVKPGTVLAFLLSPLYA